MQTVSLEITGMTCGHCVAAVDKALRGVAGVRDAKVEIGRATVTVDPAVATPDAVVEAVRDEGYEAAVAG